MAVRGSFQIAVVNQDVERVGDASRRIRRDDRVERAKTAASGPREDSFDGRFGQNLHGDRVVLVVQGFLEACLVMHKVVLARRPQQFVAVDILDVFHPQVLTPPHHGEVPQPREAGLNVVRDTDPERVVHRVGDAGVNSQVMACRQPLEAGDAKKSVPLTQRPVDDLIARPRSTTLIGTIPYNGTGVNCFVDNSAVVQLTAVKWESSRAHPSEAAPPRTWNMLEACGRWRGLWGAREPLETEQVTEGRSRPGTRGVLRAVLATLIGMLAGAALNAALGDQGADTPALALLGGGLALGVVLVAQARRRKP